MPYRNDYAPRRSSRRQRSRALVIGGIAAAVLVLIIIVIVTVVVTSSSSSDPSASSGASAGSASNENPNGDFDHRAHAVAGEPYKAVDFSGSGNAVVALDGTRSHSHYFEPGPPVVTGRVVEFSWFLVGADNAETRFAGGVAPKVMFPVGTTKIGLTVVDNTGDKNTDYTTVTVNSSLSPGAYCYYYAPVTASGAAFPILDDFASTDPAATKPVFAEERAGQGVDFGDLAAFPSQFRAALFAVRCVFLTPGTPVTASLVHTGGPVRVLVDGAVVHTTEANTAGELLSKGAVSIALASNVEAQILFFYQGPAISAGATLVLSGTDGIQRDLSRVAPVLVAIEPSSSTVEGGGRVKLVGIGLFNSPSVLFAGVRIEPELSNVDAMSLYVTVPKSSVEGTVDVTVVNAIASSNAEQFNYSSSGLPPLAFAQSNIKLSAEEEAAGTTLPSLLTEIVYGPDHRWYSSSLDGHVYSFLLSRDMQMSSVCQSESLGAQRSVLSVAFNPKDKTPRVYATSSILDWRTKGKINDAGGWQNGMVHMLEPSGNSDSGKSKCLKHIGPIITGLPVSNHDHGVNKLLFTQDSSLLIQVGGFTNAGHNTPGNSLGELDESPLSGASLVARIFNPGFDGSIKYDSNDPKIARQVSGDVSVYSPGFRNSFGVFTACICVVSRHMLLSYTNC
jgi:IPT/TIG domain